MTAILEQYRIADFIQWDSEKSLVLNPDFQRGSVWTPSARTFLIDSILRDFPIPKLYFRTAVNTKTKRSYREVVDGQQRLRAIIDFAADKFALSKRAGENSGLKYSSLSQELQERFLAYPVSVGQLLNASNDDVLEVFSRLNSYTVSLNAAEKRHAKFQGDFKWSVRRASRRWSKLFDDYKLLTTRQRVRMLDDSLVAEMFGVVIEGVQDGGQSNIDKIYKRLDPEFDDEDRSVKILDDTLDYFMSNLAEYLLDTPIFSPPHFLLLFGALTHRLYGIPKGQLASLPDTPKKPLGDLDSSISNLLELASAIASEDSVSGYEEFWRASRATTHRLASRRMRFPYYFSALN